MIITKTPFRMFFFGGGTDFSEFFKEYGGSVLSTTFDKYCYVTVRHLPRFFEYTSETVSYTHLDGLLDDFDAVYKSVPTTMEDASKAIADYNTCLLYTSRAGRAHHQPRRSDGRRDHADQWLRDEAHRRRRRQGRRDGDPFLLLSLIHI